MQMIREWSITTRQHTSFQFPKRLSSLTISILGLLWLDLLKWATGMPNYEDLLRPDDKRLNSLLRMLLQITHYCLLDLKRRFPVPRIEDLISGESQKIAWSGRLCRLHSDDRGTWVNFLMRWRLHEFMIVMLFFLKAQK